MAAEKYFPFRSVSGDRKYSAEDWAAYFALFLSDGVFYSSVDKLKVAASEGMKVKVGKGAAFIAGRMYMLETDKIMTLDTADGALSRIDRIVLRCDYTSRKITAEVVKGSYSEKPTAPELNRNSDIYELALADVYVAAGVISITQSNITDQRLNTSLCGIVTGLIDQADTEEVFNQFTAYLEEFKQASRAEFEGQQAAWEEEFDEWFEEIKGVFEGDVATELANRVLELEKGAATKEELSAIQSTSKGTMATAGWYRVAEYKGNSLNHAMGSSDNGCIVSIKELYYDNAHSEYLIKLFSLNRVQKFRVMSAMQAETSSQSITKIRYTYDTASQKAYIEVYSKGAGKNDFSVDILLPSDVLGKVWKKVDFVATAETVSGVTVTTTYDIPANANPVTDLDLQAINTTLGHKFTIVSEVADMNTVPVYTAGIVYTTAKNIPSDMNDGYGGYGLVYTVGWSNAYQIQRIVCTRTTHERIVTNNSFGEWKKQPTTEDLAKYLLLTGGTVGNGSDTAVPLVLTRKNGNYTELGFSGSDGVLGYLGFSSVDNPVFENSARNAAYPLLHTGNMADHVLPKTGGELASGSREILTLARTSGNLASLVFKGNGSKMGELGFDGTDRPAYWDSTGASAKLLLHTGNSAKVVINSARPNDTTGNVLHVW